LLYELQHVNLVFTIFSVLGEIFITL